jgi:hypothetical protein
VRRMQEQDGGVSNQQHAMLKARLIFTVLKNCSTRFVLFRPLSIAVRPKSLCTHCYEFEYSQRIATQANRRLESVKFVAWIG